jgi:hypothetical protein
MPIPLNDVGAFARHFERTAGRAERAAGDAVPAAGYTLADEIGAQLSRPGGGRVYVRRGLLHQASAPGEPPAPNTRRLLRSVEVENVGGATRVAVHGLGAAALEYGTRRIAPRPYMRPALATARSAMTRAVVSRLRGGP